MFFSFLEFSQYPWHVENPDFVIDQETTFVLTKDSNGFYVLPVLHQGHCQPQFQASVKIKIDSHLTLNNINYRYQWKEDQYVRYNEFFLEFEGKSIKVETLEDPLRAIDPHRKINEEVSGSFCGFSL